MSLLPSDEQISELRGRVAELETRVNQIEGRATVPSVAPRFMPTSTPATSPPVAAPTNWPSAWAPPPVPQEPAPFISPDAAQTWAQNSTSTSGSRPETAPNSAEATQFRQTLRDNAPSGFSPSPSHNETGKSLLDWETLVGGRLALWIGALCLFLALASLLVYVGQTLRPPTPQMRVAAGFVASLALLAGGFGARKRTGRWFADGLAGAGLAVGFLSVWGGGPHFALWSLPVSMVGFGVYSALGVALSARRDSQALLLLSATGGFLTPLLVGQRNANNLALVFLSYLLVLNVGIVAVCVVKKWREIVYGAFAATALLAWGWSLSADIEAMRPTVWLFASLGWIVFAGAACFRALWWSEETREEDSALLFAATGFYALASQWLLAPIMKGFPGAFCLGLGVALSALWFVARRRVPLDAALRANFLALACIAGALFVPLQFGQRGLVWGWMAQAVALSLVGRKSGARLLRGAGRTLWALAILALSFDAVFSLWNQSTILDSFSLRLGFCLIATALLLFDAHDDEPAAPLYATVISWGGALWIGRALWSCIGHFKLFVPAQRSEAAILLGASAVAIWSLGLWRAGVWRRQSELRTNALLILGSALCAVAGVALCGTAPLVGVRIGAFAVGAVGLWLMGSWQAHEEDSRETTTLGVACWILLGATVEVAAHSNGGRFQIPDSGATTWFALCCVWSLFAASVGALSLWRAWPKVWALAETVFALSTGALLVQSLLVSHSLVPLGNARLAAFALAWLVASLARSVDSEGEKRRGSWWLLAMLLLPLWASTQEVWNGVETFHAHFGGQWQRFASLGVSLLWSFYAASCLIGGIVKRIQNVRVGALALGALTVGKVFLLDLSFLDGGLRVLSLGGLGLALMFISWLYSRFGRVEPDALA